MRPDKFQPQRRSIRLNGYDYTQRGAYFVTIVAHDRRCIFGNIECDEMRLNPIGNIVKEVWQSIPAHFPESTNNHFMIMPNHIHGIIELVGHGAPCPQMSGLVNPYPDLFRQLFDRLNLRQPDE